MLPALVRFLNPILLVILLMLIIIAFRLVWNDFRKAAKKKNTKRTDIPADAGVRDLVKRGEIDEAIKVYMRFKGTDEFTARQAIEDLDREIRLSDSVRRDVHRLLNRNNKAAAIEAYQQATGADLEEALNYVEKQQAEKA